MKTTKSLTQIIPGSLHVLKLKVKNILPIKTYLAKKNVEVPHGDSWKQIHYLPITSRTANKSRKKFSRVQIKTINLRITCISLGTIGGNDFINKIDKVRW